MKGQDKAGVILSHWTVVFGVSKIMGGVILLSLPAPCFGLAGSPIATTQRLLSAIKSCEDDTPSPPRDRQCSLQRIEENLAISELASWLLGAYMSQLSPYQQEQFTALLTQLLRKLAYPAAAKFLAANQIEYGAQQVWGTTAVVSTTLADPEVGRITIDYHLRQVQGLWRVWDVWLDGVSLAGNLQKQIQAILAKKFYTELIARMQRKINDTD